MKKTPLEYAFGLLELRDRSIGEIRHKMKEKKFETEQIKKVVNFLIEKKFLDDEKFVEGYIRGQQSFGSAGKYKIKFKLQRLFIDRELIDEKLGEIDLDDEYNRSLELARNWLRKNASKDKKYEKLGRFLCAKGFEIDIVKRDLGELRDLLK